MTTPAASRPSDVMRRWFQEVWTEGRERAIDEFMCPTCLAHGLGAQPVRGPAEFKGFWRQLRSVFSGIRIEVVDALDQGDRCYVRCQATLRFGARTVHLPGGCISRIEGGRISECWNTWDFAVLLTEMGALPPDAVNQAFQGRRLAVVPSTSER